MGDAGEIEQIEKEIKILSEEIRKLKRGSFDSSLSQHLKVSDTVQSWLDPKYLTKPQLDVVDVSIESHESTEVISDISSEKLLAIWRNLNKFKQAGPFRKPVSESLAPDYKKWIKNPMDLQTLREKIVSKDVDTYEKFIGNIKLIHDNCIYFNGKDSIYSASARQFLRQCEKIIERAKADNSRKRPASETLKNPSKRRRK
eukprot:TRINITY_DN984_c0_g1_i4.p2 TRINITY_DN984_c0_g1~~TRINITY_DN984_c0_g1_i4.p2  ORF type:complete len:200 (+),score=31.60 TRINITY_DN984_c0_g1_i4:2060-2659(+)